MEKIFSNCVGYLLGLDGGGNFSNCVGYFLGLDGGGNLFELCRVFPRIGWWIEFFRTVSGILWGWMEEQIFCAREKRGDRRVREGCLWDGIRIAKYKIGMERWIPEGDGSATSSEVSARISPSSAKCFRRGEFGSNPNAASFAFFFWRRTRC